MIFHLLASFLVVQVHTIQSEKIDAPTVTQSTNVEELAGVYYTNLLKEWKPDLDEMAKNWFSTSANIRIAAADRYDTFYCDNQGKKDGCPLRSTLLFYATGTMDDLYKSSFALPEEILARTVHNSITGKFKEMGGIEEVVCANDRKMKVEIAKCYQNEYKKSIEDDLAKFREDDKEYTKAMTIYGWKGLCQQKKITPKKADEEAAALRAIDAEKNKEEFKTKLINLFDTYCELDLQQIFRKYRRDKDGINDAVDKAFDVERQKRVFNVLVRSIENICQFYADQLYEAVKGAGTDFARINRITLTRCERDLGCILKKFLEIYGQNFTSRLKADIPCEPRYLKSIRSLCGEPWGK